MKYDNESIIKRKQNVQKMKKFIDIILIILIYNMVLVIISAVGKIENISIFGFKAYIITTDSMKPELVNGDIIIVKDDKNLNVGDVITFSMNGEVITHRITQIIENDGEKEFKTKGDNNNIEDKEILKLNDIEGRKIAKIAYLGKIIMYLQNTSIFLVISLITMILLLFRVNMEDKKERRREKKKIEEARNSEN